MEMCDKKNIKNEYEKTKKTIEKAKNYKRKLEILIDTDIGFDNEKREIFLQEFNLSKDESDLEIKYLHLKKIMIDKINRFYEEGKKSFNQKTKINHKNLKYKEKVNKIQENILSDDKSTIKEVVKIHDLHKEEKDQNLSNVYNVLGYIVLVIFFTYILKFIYD